MRIPAEINGHKVTGLAEYAFCDNEQIVAVYVPDTVAAVDEGAFDDCEAIKEVHIEDFAAWCGITFGNAVTGNPLSFGAELYLNDVKVENLVIPEGVESIGAYAFYGVSGVRSVSFPATTKSVGAYAFAQWGEEVTVTVAEDSPYFTVIGNCLVGKQDGRLTLTFQNSVIPNDGSIKIIGNYSLTGVASAENANVVIPEGVTVIENCAFGELDILDSTLKLYIPAELHIPSTLAEIPDDLLLVYIILYDGTERVCTITIDESNPYYEIRDGMLIDKRFKMLITVTDKEVFTEIPEDGSVTSICRVAFLGMDTEEIFIPSCIEDIGSSAFYGWKESQTIRIAADESVGERWNDDAFNANEWTSGIWNDDCEAKIVWNAEK